MMQNRAVSFVRVACANALKKALQRFGELGTMLKLTAEAIDFELENRRTLGRSLEHGRTTWERGRPARSGVAWDIGGGRLYRNGRDAHGLRLRLILNVGSYCWRRSGRDARGPSDRRTLDFGLCTLYLNGWTLDRRLVEVPRRSLQAFRQLIQPPGLREDHVVEGLALQQVVQFAGPKASNERAIVRAAYKRAPADCRQVLLAADLNRRGETLQARVAFVLNRRPGAQCSPVRIATIRIAKADIIERRLKRVADGIVVRGNQRRGLTAVDQQDRKSRRSGEFVLHFAPAWRSISRMFLHDLQMSLRFSLASRLNLLRNRRGRGGSRVFSRQKLILLRLFFATR